MKGNIKIVFAVYFLLFVFAIGFMIKMLVVDRDSIVLNSYNARLGITDDKVVRGSIKDVDGNILAFTDLFSDDTLDCVRMYPFGREYAHVVGYTTFGKSGVEAVFNFSLQKLHFEVLQRLSQVTGDELLYANNVVLTLDNHIQNVAFNALGDNKGAVVVMEPSTGKILAMVSFPNFDPNSINSDWYELNSNIEQSPLLNRSTKGLYPPGSVFKIVTALAITTNNDSWKSLMYDCSGKIIIDGKEINCFDGNAHGEVDIFKAMAVSCNSFFAKYGYELGAEKLKVAAERLYFNNQLGYSGGYSLSSMSLSDSSEISEILETSIGQGKTLVTPLHMAMIASAIANNGFLMKPYILDHEEYFNDSVGNKKMPEMLDVLFSEDEAAVLKEMLIQVVNGGTGSSAALTGLQVAGKTGTAENSGLDHSWFVGFAPADEPKVAFAVLLENVEGSVKASNIAGEILRKIL